MTNSPHIARAERPAKAALTDLLAPHLDPSGEGLAGMGLRGDGADSALDQLARMFGLSGFERQLLAWCAAVEIDEKLAADTTELSGGSPRPSFRLAMATLPDPHWSATAHFGPLRNWNLVTPQAGRPLMEAPLTVDESIFDYLVGLPFSDERLHGVVSAAAPAEPSETHRRIAGAIAERLAADGSARVHLALRGNLRICESVAAAALEMAGFGASRIFASDLPTAGAELTAFAKLWSRQAALSRSGLLIRTNEDLTPATITVIARLKELVWGPLMLIGGDTGRGSVPGIPVLEVGAVAREERAELFRNALGDDAARMNGQIERASSHFDLDADSISAIAAEFKMQPEGSPSALWEISRRHARPELGSLAQRITSRAGWEDLVLPSAQKRTLREIGSHVRHRLKVYETWGFGRLNNRGLGISALFHGPSGTGKTLAAEVLGNALSLDVYRIDLSAVVSKYIGETEKNLSKIFDAAESAPVILLFDEADALFGKRSEVRDSHDRYANLEVSYLLQRVEAFSGLAILTTNMKSALDQAFLRRIRFIVNFPFPDQHQRAEIWKRVFPPEAPVRDLDYSRLARLNVAGGHIRNMAMNAAFRAAEEDSDITMQHLLQAARSEYDKLDKPLSETEFRGWSP